MEKSVKNVNVEIACERMKTPSSQIDWHLLIFRIHSKSSVLSKL